MTQDQKKWLKLQIEVQMKRRPGITAIEMRKHIKKDEHVDWSVFPRQSFEGAVKRNMDKVRETGTTKNRPGQGRPQISLAKKLKIKRLSMDKKHAGNRVVAEKVGVSKTTVNRVLKDMGAKAWHVRKVQDISPEQKVKRVTCAHWLLDNYGRLVDGRTVWGRVLNTDWSGKKSIKFCFRLFQIVFFRSYRHYRQAQLQE